MHSAARDNSSLLVIETLTNNGTELMARNDDNLTAKGIAAQHRNHATFLFLREQEEKYAAALETYMMAVMISMQGDHETVLEMSNKAIGLYPGLAKLYRTRAIAHAALGHIPDALKDLERFVDLANDDLDECWFIFNQMTALNPTGMLARQVRSSTIDMLGRKISENNLAALTSMGIDRAELKLPDWIG